MHHYNNNLQRKLHNTTAFYRLDIANHKDYELKKTPSTNFEKILLQLDFEITVMNASGAAYFNAAIWVPTFI